MQNGFGAYTKRMEYVNNVGLEAECAEAKKLDDGFLKAQSYRNLIKTRQTIISGNSISESVHYSVVIAQNTLAFLLHFR